MTKRATKKSQTLKPAGRKPRTRPTGPRAVTTVPTRLGVFEEVLSDVSAMFVRALAQEIDAQIREALRRVAAFFGADRGVLVRFSDEGQDILLSHTWSRPGIPLRRYRYTSANFPWTMSQTRRRRGVVFSSLSALPASAKVDRVYFEADGVKSMATVPLVAGGRILGAIAFVTVRRRNLWPARVLGQLRLLGEMFASALDRRQTAARLDDRIAFEAFIADVSAACVRVPGGDLDALVTSALGRVANCLGADRVSLVALTDDRRDCHVTHRYTRKGLPPTPDGPLRSMFPWVFRHLVEGGQPFVMNSRDELPPELAREQQTFIVSGDVLSFASVPLNIDGQVRWILALDSIRRAVRWPPQALLRTRLLGEVLATAIERRKTHTALTQRERLLRRSQSQQRELAARLLHAEENERRHLARELHDAVTPELASLAMDVALLHRRPRRVSPDTARELVRVEQRLQKLGGLAHGLSRALHPAVLDDLGLAKAVESECAGFEARTGIRAVLRLEPVPRALRDGLAIGVFRILQEGLRNVEKHARATVVRVQLSTRKSRLHLAVKDDGVGFDLAKVNGTPSLGLKHVFERARLLGGSVTIRSRIGHGTTTQLSVPLR